MFSVPAWKGLDLNCVSMVLLPWPLVGSKLLVLDPNCVYGLTTMVFSGGGVWIYYHGIGGNQASSTRHAPHYEAKFKPIDSTL